MKLSDITERAKMLAPVIREYVESEIKAKETRLDEKLFANYTEATDLVRQVEQSLSEKLEQLVEMAIAKALDKIELPRDGKDAAQIEVLPGIDESASYPRGTYATHKGGLWRSFQTTRGLYGWECVVNGIADFSLELADDGRFHEITLELSNGAKETKRYRIPSMIHRGVYAAGQDYEVGDCVTWAGSLWLCRKPTNIKPGDGDYWILAVKRGRDAK